MVTEAFYFGRQNHHGDILNIQPTYQAKILGGTAVILGFGARPDNFDWSLKNLQKAGDENKSENIELIARLRAAAESIGLCQILAPRPVDMNSEIAEFSELTEIMYLAPIKENTCVLRRGANADGIRLTGHMGFAMSSADCALIVVKWRDQMWVAHAGRDSLIDRKLINTRQKSKRYRSVVESIMHEIPQKFWKETEVYYGCTISPGPHFEHHWDNPKHGESNKKMVWYIERRFKLDYGPEGQIDMRELIRRQFEQFGVTQFEVDDICTFSDTNPDGTFKWHSNRRDKVKRNLFLVVRN